MSIGNFESGILSGQAIIIQGEKKFEGFWKENKLVKEIKIKDFCVAPILTDEEEKTDSS